MSPKTLQNGIFSSDLEAQRSRSHKNHKKRPLDHSGIIFTFSIVTLRLNFDFELWPLKAKRSIHLVDECFRILGQWYIDYCLQQLRYIGTNVKDVYGTSYRLIYFSTHTIHFKQLLRLLDKKKYPILWFEMIFNKWLYIKDMLWHLSFMG